MEKSEISLIFNEKDRQIEDVIDARKKTGQYDVFADAASSSQCISCRSAYSAPTAGITQEGRHILFDDCSLCGYEGEANLYKDSSATSVGPTDSEVTIVRVKRKGQQYKNIKSNWDLHDAAIPGDGTHLGESPSLVNLVTLVVGQNPKTLNNNCEGNEYLVPLSSWDPFDKPHELPGLESTMEANVLKLNTSETARHGTHSRNPLSLSAKPANLGIKTRVENAENADIEFLKLPFSCSSDKRLGLSKRISNFLRKHCSKRSKVSIADSIIDA